MYSIHNATKIEKTFDNWWSLIGYIAGHKLEDWIAHNPNDVCRTAFFDAWDHFTSFSEHERPYIIYEDDRIVNLAEIREAVNVYEEPIKSTKIYKRWYRRRMGPFTFRKDPVPGIHARRWGGYYRDNKCGKEYFARLLPIAERYNLKPARLRNNMDGVFDWDISRNREHSWKASSKSRKSWEK